jgi:(p)ppGpp synthase/HD superfamily hydrolase
VDRIKKAIDIAFEYHQGQKRKVTDAPYIVHIFDVAKYLLSEPNTPEEVIIAGILHDMLEDTDYEPDKLGEEFGKTVLGLVKFVTEFGHTADMSREEKISTWKTRKQKTVHSCKQASREELLIILADKLANLQSIRESLVTTGNSTWKYFNASESDLGWYYSALRDQFKVKIKETRMFWIFDELVDEIFGVQCENV